MGFWIVVSVELQLGQGDSTMSYAGLITETLASRIQTKCLVQRAFAPAARSLYTSDMTDLRKGSSCCACTEIPLPTILAKGIKNV